MSLRNLWQCPVHLYRLLGQLSICSLWVSLLSVFCQVITVMRFPMSIQVQHPLTVSMKSHYNLLRCVLGVQKESWICGKLYRMFKISGPFSECAWLLEPESDWYESVWVSMHCHKFAADCLSQVSTQHNSWPCSSMCATLFKVRKTMRETLKEENLQCKLSQLIPYSSRFLVSTAATQVMICNGSYSYLKNFIIFMNTKGNSK